MLYPVRYFRKLITHRNEIVAVNINNSFDITFLVDANANVVVCNLCQHSVLPAESHFWVLNRVGSGSGSKAMRNCGFFRLDRIYLTRFNKIAIQGTHQMAVDKEAISLSRVYSYDFKCT